VEVRLIGHEQFLSSDEASEATEFWGRHGVKEVDTYLGHTTRAGNLAGTYQILHREVRGCREGLPLHMATLIYTGELVLCCMDWRREVILGNIQRQSLASIWRSERRREVMAAIAGTKDVPNDFLCKRCTDAISPTDARLRGGVPGPIPVETRAEAEPGA
jgi:hypothetical protein